MCSQPVEDPTPEAAAVPTVSQTTAVLQSLSESSSAAFRAGLFCTTAQNLWVYNHPVVVPTAQAIVVPTISPTTAPYVQVAALDTPGCCCPVPTGASTDVKLVHKISVAIFTAHLFALVMFFFFVLPHPPWGIERALYLVTGVTGVCSSSLVLHAVSKCTYRLCSVLYAGVGVLDVVILEACFSGQFGFSLESASPVFVMLALPNFLGAMFAFIGSLWAFKTANGWNEAGNDTPGTVLDAEVL